MGGHKRCQQAGGCKDKDGEAQRRNVHGSGGESERRPSTRIRNLSYNQKLVVSGDAL